MVHFPKVATLSLLARKSKYSSALLPPLAKSKNAVIFGVFIHANFVLFRIGNNKKLAKTISRLQNKNKLELRLILRKNR